MRSYRWMSFALVAMVATAILAAARHAPAEAQPTTGGPRVIKGLRVKQGTLNTIQESWGLVHVMGEVVNGSRQKVAAIVVEAKVLNARKRVIDTISTPTQCVWTMAPRDVAPFDVQFLAMQGAASVQVSVKAIPYTRALANGIKFEGLQTRLSSLGSRLTVEGFIRNTTKNQYWFPKICAAAYTTRGKFVMTGDVMSFLTTESFPAKSRKIFGGEFGPYPITGLPKIIGVRVYVAACTDADRREGYCTLDAGQPAPTRLPTGSVSAGPPVTASR